MSQIKRRKVFFGSKMLNLHGKVFIGSPVMFLGTRDEMRGTVHQDFYNLEHDRYPPVQHEKLMEWQDDQLLATQVIETFRHPITKRGVVLIAAFSLLLGLIAGLNYDSEKKDGSKLGEMMRTIVSKTIGGA